MADMLVMLFCAPPSVIWDVTNTWIFGSVLCKVVIYIQVKDIICVINIKYQPIIIVNRISWLTNYSFLISYLQDVSVSVSVLTLTFIAYDRYHAICKPLQFNARKTKVAKVIGAIWTVAGTIGIPAFSLESKSPFDKNGGVAYHPCMSDDILFDLSSCTSNWNKNVDFVFVVTKVICSWRDMIRHEHKYLLKYILCKLLSRHDM